MESVPPTYSATNSFPNPALDARDRDPDEEDAFPPPYTNVADKTSALAHNPLVSNSSTTYPVGKHKHVHSLIHPLDLQDHLTLLRAFHRLKEDVRASSSETIGLNADDVWEVFLAKAVRRFELWVQKVVGSAPRGASLENPAPFQEHEIPPLDVIMMWHTYLLNPRIYYEDGLRINKAFLLLRDVFPLHHIAIIAPQPPTLTRIHHFESLTAESFHQASFSEDETITLGCPGCEEENSVRWHKRDGTGYSQHGFDSPCSKCPVRLSRETFGVARLAKDLADIKQDPQNNTIRTLMLRPNSGKPDLAFIRAWNLNVLRSIMNYEPKQYAQVLGWTFETSTAVMKIGFSSPSESLSIYKHAMKRIMKSYNTGTSFSIDLSAAVNRQFKFINKISGFGWLNDGAFPADSKGDDGKEESRTLRRCVTQYHAFLDLMAMNPKRFLVPTLGIDLAWHTHQLFHTAYRSSTMDLLGVLVDHDDSVEQENLTTSYNETAELWQSRYNVPYSVCGCPLPPPSFTSGFTSKILSKSLFSSSSSKKDSKGTINPRPDLLQISENTLEETHLSEHPGVTVTNIPEVRKQQVRRLELLGTVASDKGKGRSGGSSAIDAWVDDNEAAGTKREEHRADSIAFYLGLLADGTGKAKGVIDGTSLGIAECMVGMGIHGACQGGNIKHRPEIVRPSRGGCGGLGCGGGGGGGCGGG